MKEWLAYLLAIAVFDRRKQEKKVFIDRRRITAMQSQKMLSTAIERLSRGLEK